MARRRSFRFLAAAVSGQSHQREQGHWQRSAAHQQSDQYRLEDGGQHLAAKQNLSGSTIPSIPNQVGGAHRDQGHGRQAGPLGLPHARSEERRVGKECRSRWWPDKEKKKEWMKEEEGLWTEEQRRGQELASKRRA